MLYPLHSLFFLIIGILGFSSLIVIHELGHYLFCVLFNIKAPSFSIGFGPTIIQKKIGHTTFKISAIPLGGYVEIVRDAQESKENPEYASMPGTALEEQPLYKRLLVLFGGVICNLLSAYVLIILLFMSGLPKTPLLGIATISPRIVAVQENSDAAKAGLQAGDTLISFNNQPVEITPASSFPLPFFFLPSLAPHTPYPVQVKRNEKIVELSLSNSSQKEYKLVESGLLFDTQEVPPFSFKKAFMAGIYLTNHLIKNTVHMLKNLFTTRNVKAMGGPIMIIAATTSSAQKGIKFLFALLALLSISLALLNLLPLPILDGGQIVITLIEAIIGRPISLTVRMYIAAITWILFLLLFVYLSINDIVLLAMKNSSPTSMIGKCVNYLYCWLGHSRP